MNPLITEILVKRGILQSEQEFFLHPEFSRDTHDPFLMKGMKEAVARIEKAIQGGEKIAIFGDYDADGVPATALLVRAFQDLGVEVLPFIPTRQAGYGLTTVVVEVLKKAKINLLITVDNGTVAKAEIALLAESGIATIVCDHHQPDAEHIAEQALAILNPKQADCPYPFKELCGCAIAWKLAWALYQKMAKNPEPLKWHLDLVALSTVADMVPLVGENRVLTIFGLKVFRKTRNPGLQALAEVAGVSLATISAGMIGFRLAPRINAPSRMHQEMVEGEHSALRLLITKDVKEAHSLAKLLDDHNNQRQLLLERHLQEAEALVAAKLERRALVIYQEEWSTGVIGLVAGRLMERYRRPVIVLAKEGEEIKGSVRSVDGINAVEWLGSVEEQLVRFGGHSKAAGLTLQGDSVDLLETKLEEWLVQHGHTLESLQGTARRSPDLSLPLGEVTLELAEDLESLAPFGIGFPEPLFTTECLIKNTRKVGKEGQHLAAWLEQTGAQKKAIAFNQGGQEIEEGKKYQVNFAVDVEEWNHQRSPVCSIKQILL